MMEIPIHTRGNEQTTERHTGRTAGGVERGLQAPGPGQATTPSEASSAT